METVSSHLKDKKVAGSRQHGFVKRKSCLTNLIVFYGEVMRSQRLKGEEWILFILALARLLAHQKLLSSFVVCFIFKFLVMNQYKYELGNGWSGGPENS